MPDRISSNRQQLDNEVAIAYGELKFPCTRNEAKFVRISKETKIKALSDLLIKEWKLNPPSFIISVTGGAKDFKMKPELKRKFEKSIIETAESTGAWIVTGGTHCGVMKLIGNAIQKYSSSKKLVALGIATWGIIADRDKLAASKNDIVFYDKEDPQALNKQHTHFILVDDGTENEFGKEIDVRAKLEKYIAERNKGCAICVIVQGGPKSLETVYQALHNKTSVVVVDGSGGWANILASLYNISSDKISEDLIKGLMEENGCVIDDSDPDFLTGVTVTARKCTKRKDFIFVFSLDELKGGIKDLCEAIKLSRLETTMTLRLPADEKLIHKQTLVEVLRSNDVETARSYLRKNGTRIKKQTFVSLLPEALEKDNAEFTKLYLQYAYSKKEKFEKDALHNNLTKINQKYSSIFECKQSLIDPHYYQNNNLTQIGFQDVLRDLFFYALVINKRKCAKLLWEEMEEEKLSSAFIACRVLTAMRDSFQSNEKRDKIRYQNHFEDYQSLSFELLTDCFDDDTQNTVSNLKRRMRQWGKLTCFRILTNTEDKKLISHPAFQAVLDEIWQGGIKKPVSKLQSVLQSVNILLAAFTLFLIPFLITFKEVSKHTFRKKNSVSPDELETSRRPDTSENVLTSFKSKVLQFYHAPRVKFHLTFFFYVIFLILFSYILLLNLFENISIPEWILFFYVISLVFEEKRQFNYSTGSRWFKKPGNKLDSLGFTLYLVGFFLRLARLMVYARVFLCLAFILFCLRILSMFTVQKDLGPQVLMIQKMLKDLVVFIIILIVFLFAYGVSSQSLLYPRETNFGNALAGSLKRPYLNLYGELFLSEIDYNPSADEFSCTDNSTLLSSGFQPCPAQNVIVPIISSLYLLFTNVLLLNLLIAMFTYTLNKYVDQTDQIWRKQRLNLVEEYYQRHVLAVPFSIIWTFIETFYISEPTTRFDFENPQEKIYKSNNDDLLKWQNKMTESYSRKKEKESQESLPGKIEDLQKSYENLEKKISEVLAHLDEFQSINEKFDNLNETMFTLNKTLTFNPRESKQD